MTDFSFAIAGKPSLIRFSQKHGPFRSRTAIWIRAVSIAFASHFLFSTFAFAAPPQLLDIYFEESHAGTFYHLASTLPLEEPHTLILIDAHSDASAVMNSDTVRAAIRKVPDVATRDALFAGWRKTGAIQCYDWLEPLMPAPIADVVWVGADTLDPLTIARQQTLARESLDGLLEAFPRESGELGPRFRAIDRKSFARDLPNWTPANPAIVSIDLDYFASVSTPKLAEEFTRVFEGVLRVPKLRAITFSLSRPWLRNDEQAEALTALALDAATNIANARVHFAPGADAGPDRSRRAQELRKQGAVVPRLDLAAAGPELRTLLLSRRQRLAPDSALQRFTDDWAQDPFAPRVQIRGETPDPDGWHRLRAQRPAIFELDSTNPVQARWFALVPAYKSANVADLSLGFAEDAPRWLERKPQLLGKGTTLSADALAPLLEPITKAGTVIIYATVERDGQHWRSNELRVAFRANAGFRAALSEGFARPYAFGCGLLAGGPDALIANDCANFVISALRREGWRIPWGDPKQFATRLETLGDSSPATPLAMSREDVDAGAIVHFGSHVGAVWEDKDPVGVLSSEDLIAHHLEGLPEIVPLRELSKTRPQFRLMRPKPEPESIRLVFGGDVMLGRGVADAIDRGANPFAAITELLTAADWACVNLECVPSALGEPVPGKRYHFRGHAKTPALLTGAGIDCVSLANNHTRDFGDNAFHDALGRLRSEKLTCADGTDTPVRFAIRGQKFAAFACEDRTTQPLLTGITEAAREATVIVLPHWGAEHATAPNQDQAAMADELIAAGARIIIGSGPHARQPLEFRDGALIAWSLGNLIFDGPGPDSQWSRGTLLEATLTRDGRIIRAKSHSIQISKDGFPTPIDGE